MVPKSFLQGAWERGVGMYHQRSELVLIVLGVRSIPYESDKLSVTHLQILLSFCNGCINNESGGIRCCTTRR